MSDKPVVHMGENSPEYIAWRLLKEVAVGETNAAGGRLSRERVLDLYAECLLAVRDPLARLGGTYKLPPQGK